MGTVKVPLLESKVNDCPIPKTTHTVKEKEWWGRERLPQSTSLEDTHVPDPEDQSDERYPFRITYQIYDMYPHDPP